MAVTSEPTSTGAGRPTVQEPAWVWVALVVVALGACVAAIVLDAPVWAQALVLAAVAAAAAAGLHRHDAVASRPEVDRGRPGTHDPAERLLLRSLDQPRVARRTVLTGALVGLVGGVTLLRWRGPRPAEATVWEVGTRLVTTDGDPLRPQDVPPGAAVTVWPEGAVDRELVAVMLIRLREAPQPPTRIDQVVDDTLVAYSRICTHAGCPVALYRDIDQALFCPCHQATFDAGAGAVPTFGPASRPLPQLPLGVDGDGFLIAVGDFPEPPGPPGGGP